jgi:integrase
MLINRGVDPYTIGKLTGHKNIKMIEVYAKLLDKQKSKAVNVLDDILSPEEATNNL